MMVKKYRKKPVEIEAVQWTGINVVDVLAFVGESLIRKCKRGVPELYIKTLEGKMHVSVGDYIIKGIHDEFYTCKPDIFKKTYCSVDLDSGVDWSAVPVDAKIYVRGDIYSPWIPRYFSRYKNGFVYAFCFGCTSFSCEGEKNKMDGPWKYAKLAEVEDD